MKPVRWALWGCGEMARAFVTDLLSTNGNVVHSVASRTPERARAFATALRGVACHTSLESLLDDADIDVVYVSTPPVSHLKDCLAVLSAGKALLCEKPLAIDSRQVQAIISAAKLRGLFCMEAMWMLCVPAVREARRLVQDGAIGAPRILTANFAYHEHGPRIARLVDPDHGAGALLDRGVYPLHLATALCGPASVSAAALQDCGATDSQASCLLKHEGGVHSQLVASFLATGSNSAEVTGETGILRLHAPFYGSQGISISTRRAPPAAARSVTAPPDFKRTSALRRAGRRLKPWLELLKTHTNAMRFAGNGYQFEIQEAADCIRNGRNESSIVPLQQSLDVMNLVESIRATAGSRPT